VEKYVGGGDLVRFWLSFGGKTLKTSRCPREWGGLMGEKSVFGHPDNG
jgi:hypothetical protein